MQDLPEIELKAHFHPYASCDAKYIPIRIFGSVETALYVEIDTDKGTIEIPADQLRHLIDWFNIHDRE